MAGKGKGKEHSAAPLLQLGVISVKAPREGWFSAGKNPSSSGIGVEWAEGDPAAQNVLLHVVLSTGEKILHLVGDSRPELPPELGFGSQKSYFSPLEQIKYLIFTEESPQDVRNCLCH